MPKQAVEIRTGRKNGNQKYFQGQESESDNNSRAGNYFDRILDVSESSSESDSSDDVNVQQSRSRKNGKTVHHKCTCGNRLQEKEDFSKKKASNRNKDYDSDEDGVYEQVVHHKERNHRNDKSKKHYCQHSDDSSDSEIEQITRKGTRKSKKQSSSEEEEYHKPEPSRKSQKIIIKYKNNDSDDNVKSRKSDKTHTKKTYKSNQNEKNVVQELKRNKKSSKNVARNKYTNKEFQRYDTDSSSASESHTSSDSSNSIEFVSRRKGHPCKGECNHTDRYSSKRVSKKDQNVHKYAADDHKFSRNSKSGISHGVSHGGSRCTNSHHAKEHTMVYR